MRLLSTLIGVGLLCVSISSLAQSGSSQPEEKMRLPPYPNFIEACVVSIAKNTDGVDADNMSNEELVIFSVICQCGYDQLSASPLKAFGGEEYEGALMSCLSRAQSDTKGFLAEYTAKTYENLKKHAEQEE